MHRGHQLLVKGLEDLICSDDSSLSHLSEMPSQDENCELGIIIKSIVVIINSHYLSTQFLTLRQLHYKNII